MDKAELITGSEIEDRWTRENWRIGATAPKTGETVWLVLNDFNEAPRRGHWYAVDNCWLVFDGYAVERYLDRAVLCWRPIKEKTDSAVSSEIVTEPAAKRVTTIHVIDANSNEHDYTLHHAADLRIWEMGDGRIDVGEIDADGQPKGSVASFPSSWAVVLRENVLDPALSDMCTEYARAIADGLRERLDEELGEDGHIESVLRESFGTNTQPVANETLSKSLDLATSRIQKLEARCARHRGTIEEGRRKVADLRNEVRQLKSELERMILSSSSSRVAAEARRILESEVKLEPGVTTFVRFKYLDGIQHDIPAIVSYAVSHDDEMMSAWRIVAYLVNELRKLANGGAL